MKRIGLLSDTHGDLHPESYSFFEQVDEIWHAGDIGSIEVADKLEKFKPLRAVYGNIDNHKLRARYPEHLRFETEGLRIWITHIGGYPGNYARQVKPEIFNNPPDIFIAGHSHILKVMRDKKRNCLHMNQGAAGIQGFHKLRTMLRFKLDKGNISNLEIHEIPRG